MYKLSESSRARLSGVDPRIFEIIDLALKITLIDFGIPQDAGLRTAERQKELFDKGVSKCDGYNNLSAHQSGLAFDVYAYTNGKASWDTKELLTVATAILQAASQLGYSLEYGGNYKSFIDMPHFQLTE